MNVENQLSKITTKGSSDEVIAARYRIESGYWKETVSNDTQESIPSLYEFLLETIEAGCFSDAKEEVQTLLKDVSVLADLYRHRRN